jgi:hypothetical protein
VDIIIVFGLALLVATGLATLYAMTHRAREEKRIRKLLQSKSRTALGQAKVGDYQKMVGSARLTGEPLTSPLTKRPCIGYHVRVVEILQNGTRVVVDEHRVGSFVLQDPTGKALVQALTAKMVLEWDEHGECGITKRAPQELEDLLVERGETAGSGLLARSLRYAEGIISVDERVAVLGLLQRERQEEGTGYRDAHRLVVTSDADHPLYVCDHADTRL